MLIRGNVSLITRVKSSSHWAHLAPWGSLRKEALYKRLEMCLGSYVRFLPWIMEFFLCRPSSLKNRRQKGKHFSKQKPTRWSLINNYLKIGSFGESKPWSSSCVNELRHRLLKDHKNLKLDWGVGFLWRPSKIHSCEERWKKYKRVCSAYVSLPFPWVNQAHWWDKGRIWK